MKIGWILSGNKDVAGARIQGWNMHKYFINQDIYSEVLSDPSEMNTDFHFSKKEIKEFITRQYDVILVQKIQSGKNFEFFLDECKKSKTKVIYIGIDRINLDFAISCDAIITVSDYIKNKVPKQHQNKVFKVFDGFEHNGELQKKHTTSKKITLVFTSNITFPKFPQIKYLPKNVSLKIIGPSEERMKKFAHKLPFNKEGKLFSDTPYNFEYILWDLKTVEKEILDCDVAVIPYPDNLLKENFIIRKSSNRLLMFMSYGIPTIVSPHPEYKHLIKQGENGFIANNPSEWIKYIEFLRDNPEKRKEIGQKAKLSVIDKYSLKRQGELYLKIIKKVLMM